MRQRLWQRVDETKNAVINAGWKLPPVRSPILPLHVGEEMRAIEFADKLRADGILVPAIRYPTVARGAARLRLTVSAAHTSEDIARLGQALSRQLQTGA